MGGCPAKRSVEVSLLESAADGLELLDLGEGIPIEALAGFSLEDLKSVAESSSEEGLEDGLVERVLRFGRLEARWSDERRRAVGRLHTSKRKWVDDEESYSGRCRPGVHEQRAYLVDGRSEPCDGLVVALDGLCEGRDGAGEPGRAASRSRRRRVPGRPSALPA